MKTKLFAVLFFAFTLNQIETHATTTFNPALRTSSALADEKAFVKSTADQPTFAKATAAKGGDPVDIKVVVSQKRIWLVADEMPMKCLKTQIKNAEGKIVLEKCFSSKCAEWFLNIEALPKGEYTLYLGDRVEKFKK
ncbi:MAG: hypothetical protein H7246_17285 [Phycisphaerae bacterium]|nr:hypothetical protein [Saprospiraceae bacterium]